MIDCADLVFSVGSAGANSLLQKKAEALYISFTPTSADVNAVPGTMSNSRIAYLTNTMHDGQRILEKGRGDEHNQQTFKAPDSTPPASDGAETDEPRRFHTGQVIPAQNKGPSRLTCRAYGVAMNGINWKKLLWAIR